MNSTTGAATPKATPPAAAGDELPDGCGRFPFLATERFLARGVLRPWAPGADHHPMSAEEYRRHAAECLRLSKISTESGTKSILLNMAVSWTTLAEQAEKNLQNDVVYEPPLKKRE